jgi:hypothetical protein
MSSSNISLQEIEDILQKSEPISLSQIKQWIHSSDLEIQAIAYYILTSPRLVQRITPSPSPNEAYTDCITYLLQAIVKNKDGQWANTRYEAGANLVQLFQWHWNAMGRPQSLVKEIETQLKELYKAGDPEVKLCVITAILEHLFLENEITNVFVTWMDDPELRSGYEEALGYARTLTEARTR